MVGKLVVGWKVHIGSGGVFILFFCSVLVENFPTSTFKPCEEATAQQSAHSMDGLIIAV